MTCPATTSCSTARWWRWSTGRRPSVRSPTGCTSRKADRAARLAERVPVTYLVFDLLRLDGRDLLREPLERRRELLAGLGLADAHWQVPDGVRRRRRCCSRRPGSRASRGSSASGAARATDSGVRSPHWLKFPHRRRGSFVVGGWRHETDSTTRLGAVLVGEPTRDGLLYRGRVGSGIAGRVGPMLREALAPFARDTSPFADEVPRVDAQGTLWVEPVLVVDVETLGLSSQERLRQPSYRRRARRPDPRRPGRLVTMSRSRLLGIPALLVALLTLDGLLAAPAQAESIRLGGVDVRVTDSTAQVVTVNRTSGYRARVVFWARTDAAAGSAGWRPTTAGSGTAAWCPPSKRKQGTGTTPLGTFGLPFGLRHPGPRRRLDDPLPQDPPGRLLGAGQPVGLLQPLSQPAARAASAGGCRRSDPNSSERLTDYPKQYELSIVTGFNRRQVRHRGSGIFLHVNGRGATAGCVSAPAALHRPH